MLMEPGSKIPEEFDRSILQQEDIILYEAYRGVFEMMACGAMIFSEDGILLKANKKALELFGVNGRQAVESSILNYSDYLFFDMDGYRLPVKKWPVNRLLNHEFLKDDKYIIKNINKSKYSFVSITGIPQFDSNGQFKSGILILHDISDQVETDNRLEEEIEKTLKKSNELKEYQEILKTERQLLQSIIDNIPVMISIYDEALGSITLNNALTEITGWTQRDIANRNVMELVYPDPMYRAKVAGFMKSLKKGFKDFTMRTKEGRDIETSWANVRLADGRMAGVGVDISGRKRLEKELILAREKAERENRVQSAFIQNISHEVRTPMNSILGFTELLHKEITTASGREFLSAISYNGEQLLRLIDDIVDFSRLDKNEMSLSKEEISVKYLMEQTQKQFSGLKKKYNKRHIAIKLKPPRLDYENIMLYTDIHRLQQVLTNLMSNALKYTEEGQVEVGFDFTDDKQALQFFIKDSGIGIKKEYHDRVFQRFNRFHQTHKYEFRGTGLGLAICKHLVHLMGGEIWFESEPGKGSVFYFTHPYMQQTTLKDQFAENDTKDNCSLPDLSNRSLLIAEDDQYSFMILNLMLQDTKATVLHANTGKKAAELAEKNKVDLIFLDIRMPEMDGYKVLKKIRKKYPDIPVIAQTANALPEDKEKSRLAGFSYHAVKPISKDELYSILNRFLK